MAAVPDTTLEGATDALVDGDRVLAPGSARAALSHRNFRLVWGGTFLSNIGTWMQNVLLGAYGYELTHSATYVGVLFFAQLGPLLLVGPLGGLLADVVDRRRLLIITNLEQLVFSVALAVIVATPHPSHAAIAACVLVIGIGNALSAPALSAILPALVPREDLTGAVSLQSVQMNLSRVVGPAIGAPLYAQFGAAPVFALNAATYLFAVGGVLIAEYPRRPEPALHGSGHFLAGFAVAWHDRYIRRVLVTVATMSFFALPFVGLMPAVADENLGIAPKTVAYGLLYATFGLGAAIGAMSVGTLFVEVSKSKLARRALLAFALLLATFGLLRVAPPAFLAVGVLGFAYFIVITSLSTALQAHLEDAVRGRVMALWIMAFGGMVPLGVLAGGWIEERTSITAVLVAGAVVAALLARYCDLDRVSRPVRVRDGRPTDR